MVTTVIVAHGEPVYRAGLRSELAQAPSVEVVADAADGDEALRLAKGLKPDVMLLDVDLREVSAFSVAASLRRDCPGTKVVAIGTSDQDALLAMLAAGVAGYVLRDETPARIVQAVEAAAAGNHRFSRVVVEAAVPPDAVPSVVPAPLTPRERQVLSLLAQGAGNDSIAQSLGISGRTVRFHLQNVYRKLSLAGRGELIARVARAAGRLNHRGKP